MNQIWRTSLVAVVLCGLGLAPAAAGAERIVTRQGEVIVGQPRFEGETLVVRRADGSEVRIPRAEVERIELEQGQQPPPAAGAPAPGDGRGSAAPPPADGGGGAAPPPPGTPASPRRPPPPRDAPAPEPSDRSEQETPRRRPPSYPRYVPPPPQSPPDPSRGRRMLEHVGFRNGLGVRLGYHRGLAAGVEWQQRLARYVGVGIGGQVGLAANVDVACPTVGGTARIYGGNEHRFVGEVGYGLNRIDPYLGLSGSEDPTCGEAEKNFAPEFSAGYQFASRRGFLFEVLGGATWLTNEALQDEHDDVAPLFQINIGYLFR